nr:MAG TPA: hypothetical protein [Caudoviricetes sp.]
MAKQVIQKLQLLETLIIKFIMNHMKNILSFFVVD